MNGLRRAFLAVVPPPDVLRWTASYADVVRVEGHGLRWIPPEQRHLTLQFLGRVDDPDRLAKSVADSVRWLRPFTVVLGGAGAFPSARRASVLWLGVRDGAEELTALAHAVNGATAPLGFAGDERSYEPHLTLARSARSRDVRALVEQLWTGPAGPPWTVEEVVLFESDTRPTGAVHLERGRFALRADGTRSANPVDRDP